MTIKLYTTAEAAQLLKISTRTMRKYIENGKIKAVRLGRGWRIPEQSINELIAEAMQQETEK